MSPENQRRFLVDGIHLDASMKGVGRYVANVLRRFASQGVAGDFTVLVRREATLPELPRGSGLHYLPIRYRNHLAHGLATVPLLAARLKTHAAWIPYETTIGPMVCPFAMLSHDIPGTLARIDDQASGRRQSLPRRLWGKLDGMLILGSLRRADVVMCNSDYVGRWQQEIGVPSQRIVLAPCAPGADFAGLAARVDVEAVRAGLGFPDGYVLAFETGDSRDRGKAAIDAMALAAASGCPQGLVIAGTRTQPVRDQLSAHAAAKGLGQRLRLLPFMTDAEAPRMAELYAAAAVYLDLSPHEGFGMQVVEAMSCGAAVLCGRGGALPDVTGGAAVMLDVLDGAEVACGLIRLLRDPQERQRRGAAGRIAAARFDWDQTARTVGRILNQLAGGDDAHN